MALDFSSGISRKVLFRIKFGCHWSSQGNSEREEMCGGRTIESGCSVSMEFNSRMKIRLEVFGA